MCFRSALNIKHPPKLNKAFVFFARGIITKSTIWDSLVFYKIQRLLGDRVELLVTGAAPLSDQVMKFARAALGCLVCNVIAFLTAITNIINLKLNTYRFKRAMVLRNSVDRPQ